MYYHPLNIRHFNYYNRAIEDDFFFELARQTPWSNITLERVAVLFTGYEPLQKGQSKRISASKRKGEYNKVFQNRVSAAKYSFLREVLARKGNCKKGFTLSVQNQNWFK